MSILKIDHHPNLSEIGDMSQVFGNYVKLVADIELEILYGGGQLHADMEKILIDSGSKQEHVWGGGIDLDQRLIDCRAVANIRPSINRSIEILNQSNRIKFVNIVKKYFPEFHE